jgi:probable rRNA maturation factor
MNEVFVDFSDDLKVKSPLSAAYLHEYALRVLKELDVDGRELSILLCDDDAITELNRDYRGKDESTDVLSFAQQEAGSDFFPDMYQLLGDIIISTDTLKRNAEYFTVPMELELKRLVIHGILHLIGMDHETNDAAEPMLVRQEELLLRVQENDVT